MGDQMSGMNFDEENPTEAGELRVERRGRYLSVKASIKEDLQEIFELQKEIGSAVYSVHRLTSLLNSSASAHYTASADNSVEVAALVAELQSQQQAIQHHLSEVNATVIDRLNAVNLIIQDRLNRIGDFTDAFSEHQEKVDRDWARIQRASEVTLKFHGVDPHTLADRDETLKSFGKFMDRTGSAIVSLLISTLFSTFIWLYTKTVVATNQEAAAATKAELAEIKAIADSVKKQTELLNAHMAEESKKRSK